MIILICNKVLSFESALRSSASTHATCSIKSKSLVNLGKEQVVNPFRILTTISSGRAPISFREEQLHQDPSLLLSHSCHEFHATPSCQKSWYTSWEQWWCHKTCETKSSISGRDMSLYLWTLQGDSCIGNQPSCKVQVLLTCRRITVPSNCWHGHPSQPTYSMSSATGTHSSAWLYPSAGIYSWYCSSRT